MNQPACEPRAWTIRDLLAWIRDRLADRGVEDSRLCAELLVAHALGRQRIELYLQIDECPSEPQLADLRRLVRKAADHTPIAYLTGRKEFYSLDFRVSPSVLIPRPETESLVENVIRHAESPSRGERPLRICDVGTGSGCIAVALAKHLPACKITAVDVSPSALALARENAVAHDVSNRVRFARADVMSGLNGPYDIVAANPPYIRTDELESLPPSVRDHEPRIALIGGDDGLEVIRSIVRQSAELLAPGGSLYVEIGHAQADEVIGSMIDVGPWSNVDCVKDLLGVRRIIVAERRWEPGESHGLLRH